MSKLFLTYSSKDETRVVEIRDAIEAFGIHCWMAKRDIPPGENFAAHIPSAIEEACGVVVFLSANYIASPEVVKEINLASKKRFFPIRLDDLSPENIPDWLKYHLADSQWVDARTDWPSAAKAIATAVGIQVPSSEEVSSSKLAALMTQNPAKWYETRRNELLGLLNEANTLDVPEKYEDELRQTARKCQEDAFEIALVGEFQGGKSTTFNALCDGRDISPRGLGGGGIKTSAAVISAQNIAGNETKDGLPEWAEVTFKPASAIALGLSNILRRPLMDSKAFRQRNAKFDDEAFAEALATDDGFASLVDLDDAECRRILLDATDTLWSRWEESHAALSDDDLDQLRIATLQLRFWGSPEKAEMESHTILPIDRFQTLIAFPKDWATRWLEGRKAQFGLEEVAFVFVHAVLVRIHSENLQRLGCRITDCPGLFANAYDTSVARRTILNADAVWYLINGEKQIGQKDLEIIRAIAAMGMLGKIEATCNLKGPHEQKMAEIIPTTKAALANAGHKIDVLPYNARLAFLATQGDLLLHRPALFSALDRACMVIDAKGKDDAEPSAMWAKMVRRVGSAAELEEIEEIDELEADSVALVRRESHLDGILSKLETEIIPQKAQSVLINRGSDRAAKALVAYEGVLKASEEAAEAEEGKWRAEVEKAREALADFVDRANVAIDRSALYSERNELAADMAREVADMAFGDKFTDELSNRIGAAVKKRYSKFYFKKSTLRQDLMGEIVPIVSDAAKNAMVNAMSSWLKSRSSATKKTLKNRAESLVETLQDIWENRDLKSAGLAELQVPVLSVDFITACGEDTFDGILSEKDIGNIRLEGILGAVGKVLVGILAAMAVVVIVATVFSLVTGTVVLTAATAHALFFGGKELFGELFKSKEQKKAEKKAQKEAEEKADKEKLGKIASMLRPKIADALASPDFRTKVEAPLSIGFRDSLKGAIAKIRDSLEILKADFEKERVAEPEKMFGKSVAERKRIAADNKSVRTKTIEPLRKRIETFKAAVISELAS